MFADIVIVGGGASGLAAAVGAREAAPQAEIVIAERLDRVGKKILATGNGRCNLSNTGLSQEHFHGSFRNINDILSKSPTAEKFFRSLGVLCTTDAQGRIYPRSESAATVLNALRLRTAEAGITELCGFDMTQFRKKDGKWELSAADGRKITCRKIIFAAGGYAAPQYGTDGSVMRMLRDRSYRTEKICPAVAPLRVSADTLKGLKGVRAKGNVSAAADGKVIASETGEIQFTENSLSGICVFNMARYFQQYEGKMKIRLDLAPDMGEEELFKYLEKIRRNRAECELNELLTGAFTKNLAVYLTKNILGKPMTDKISSLSDNELKKLCCGIKALEFKVTGSSSWQNSQATAGGIHKSCVDSKLESVIDKGIYLCGELLDVDGDCGGYNLQWAWSSGLFAGKNCGLSLKGER